MFSSHSPLQLFTDPPSLPSPPTLDPIQLFLGVWSSIGVWLTFQGCTLSENCLFLTQQKTIANNIMARCEILCLSPISMLRFDLTGSHMFLVCAIVPT